MLRMLLRVRVEGFREGMLLGRCGKSNFRRRRQQSAYTFFYHVCGLKGCVLDEVDLRL